ncbi:MAG: flavin reductase family protein [Sneathiellaceae bacterium]
MTHVNPVAFRQAASRFVTGVAVLTAPDDGDRLCGMTANSFVTVSLSPPTVLVAIRPGRMHRAIGVARRYAVNVLPEDGQGLSHYFAGRPDAAGDPGFHLAGGLPRLDGCVAFFACEVTRIVDVGDHSLFIAEVSACDHRDAPPLVFYSSRYHVGAGRPVEG